MIEAGKLDRRITLHSAGGEQTGRDEFGFPIYGDAPEINVWAQCSPVRDAEKMAANEVMATKMARFVIRHSSRVSSVSPTWSLTFEGEVWGIEGVKEIGRREGIEITAARRAE